MKKNIELGVSKQARLSDGEPFLIAVNEDLELEFSSSCYVLTDLVICLKNGNRQGQHRIRDGHLIVPMKYLLAGNLEIGINLMAQGEIAKHWDCVPVVIKELDGGYCATDAITALSEKVSEMETFKQKYDVLMGKYNALAAAHNALAETVSAMKENY